MVFRVLILILGSSVALANHGGRVSEVPDDVYAPAEETSHPDSHPSTPQRVNRPEASLQPTIEVTQKFIKATNGNSGAAPAKRSGGANPLPLAVALRLPDTLTFFLYTGENEKFGKATMDDYRNKYLTQTIPVSPFKQSIFEKEMDKAYNSYVKNWQELPSTVNVVIVSPNQEATGEIKTDEELWPIRDLNPWAQKLATKFKKTPEDIGWDLLVPVPHGLRCALPRPERVGLNKKSEITDPGAWADWLAKFPVFIGGKALSLEINLRSIAASTYISDAAYFCATDRDMPYLLKK